MRKWLRRIRGAIGIGLTWAAAWFGAGLLLLLVVGLGAADVPFPLFFGLLGFLAGVTFSGILGAIEGRRSFDQMSLPRFAGWGAVGGLLLSGIFVLAVALGGESLWGEILVLAPVFALAGAASAGASLALARMAKDRELPGPGSDPAEAELTGRQPHRVGISVPSGRRVLRKVPGAGTAHPDQDPDPEQDD